MIPAAVLHWAMLSIGVFSFALASLSALERLRRQWVEQRRLARVEPLRPTLVQMIAGDGVEQKEAFDLLLVVDVLTWRAIEPSVTAMLLKVRGETHQGVVRLLDERGTLDRARRRLSSRSVTARAHAAEILGWARCADVVPRLERLLRDRDPDVRAVAARSLGRIGDAAATPSLLNALVGHRSVPPRVVATAVLRFGGAAHLHLMRALETGAGGQRAVAAEIAGLAGAVPAVAQLTRLLIEDDDPEVRIRCARALGRIGAPSAVEALAKGLGDAQPTPLRVVCARALGEIGDPRAAYLLVTTVRNSDHRLAWNAAESLAKCGPIALRALRDLAVGEHNPHAEYALACCALRGIYPPGEERPAPLSAPVRQS